MTKEDFERAKEIQEQIDVLEKFVDDCMDPITTLWFARCREARTFPITLARGRRDTILNAINASDRLSTRIMVAVTDELHTLREEFDSIGEES